MDGIPENADRSTCNDCGGTVWFLPGSPGIFTPGDCPKGDDCPISQALRGMGFAPADEEPIVTGPAILGITTEPPPGFEAMKAGDIARVDRDGTEIPLSPKEMREARARLRNVIETGRVVLAPGVEQDLKRLGLDLDQVLSMVIGEKKH